MKKFLIITSCFLLTSCFKITERIKHHNDESGEYTLTIDFSQSWFKTKSAIFLEEVNGVKIPNEQEITQKLADFKRKAATIDGISNVRTTTNFDDFIFIINLDYKNLEALNAVMNSINNQKQQTNFLPNKSGGFVRNTNYPIPKKLGQDPNKKADLQAATITAIYSFDKNIQSVGNSRSKLSKNQKTIFLKQNVYDVLQYPLLMNNSINL
ncbi:hypothetical protein HNP99_000880 [Flavobacterium sp. 28A]|uniref:hypothetical protein n=1 Tax=Flavobacterium sp. 28A TaxID=2735895 RepID=UPI001570CA70|nr:hypothetical protein [Flavobacterium sp. 28A]NRT14540.1 hypothetical protein [Flavobacterium sp. 28A]